jgi:hypothetical protein
VLDKEIAVASWAVLPFGAVGPSHEKVVCYARADKYKDDNVEKDHTRRRYMV